MNDFKVGDRVEVVAAESAGGYYKNGDVFTIAKVDDDYGELDMVEMTDVFLHSKEVRHAPAIPDLITINRADLPEVRNDGSLILRSGSTTVHENFESARMRSSALERLALAEFLEVREKAAEEAAAEKEAVDKLNKRRDELAKEVAKRSCYVNYQNFTYEDHVPATQAAINMFIELEDPRG